jgi:hypothetical protein
MRDQTFSHRLRVLVSALLLVLPAAAAGQEFTTDFFLETCTFVSRDTGPTDGNPFFRLEPGHQLHYEGEDDGEDLELTITVLPRTELIEFTTARGQALSVRARVIEEREWVDGELVEVSRNFFARCRERNDVFYFGETVDIYEDGEIVSHDGAWRAGEGRAQPGIILPGTFLLGARYYQEIAPRVALDRAENTDMGLRVHVPAGRFQRCVEVTETTPLNPDEASLKVYCPGVGLVRDGDELELVEVVEP